MNTTKKNYDYIKKIFFLQDEIKKLSIQIENEVFKQKSEIRDDHFQEFNAILKELNFAYRYFPVKYMTENDMVKMRKAKDNNAKKNHLMKMDNFKKINNEIELEPGEYLMMPKLDGISILAWRQNPGVMYLTRCNNEEGLDKSVLIDYFFPELTRNLNTFFKMNKECLGVRGELILDNDIKSYNRYIRVFNKSVIENISNETGPLSKENSTLKNIEALSIPNHPYVAIESSVEEDPRTTSINKEEIDISDYSIDKEIEFKEVENAPIIDKKKKKKDVRTIECSGKFCVDRKDKMTDNYHTIYFNNVGFEALFIEFWVLKTENDDEEDEDTKIYSSKHFDIPTLLDPDNNGFIVDWGSFAQTDKASYKHCLKTKKQIKSYDMSFMETYSFLGRKKVDNKIISIKPEYSKLLVVLISEDYNTAQYEIDLSDRLPTDNVCLELNFDIVLRRELIAGLANRKEINSQHEDVKNNVHLLFYQCYKSPNPLLDDLKLLSQLNVEIAPTLIKKLKHSKLVTTEYANEFIDKYFPKKYDCDGIVIRPNNSNFEDIIGLKKTVIVQTKILDIKWKKSSSGSVRPFALIKPVFFNKKTYTSVNLFSFDSVVSNMYSAGDLVEIKFVADSAVINRNLTNKKIDPNKFQIQLLKNFEENVWVEGAHLITSMENIKWFILKLAVPKLKEDSFIKFLNEIDLTISCSIIDFLNRIRNLYNSLDEVRLKSSKNFIIAIIDKILTTDDSKLSLWSIQIPGMQYVTLKHVIENGLTLVVNDNCIVKKFGFKNEELFDKNPTVHKLKNKLDSYFKNYNFFIKFKQNILSTIKT